MKTFRAVMWSEMRVLWRRRSFWILQAVLLLPAAAIIIISLFDSSASQLFYGQGIPGLGLAPLLYLVMPILAGPSLLRDLESTGELLWSSPLDPLVHHTGMFTGLWIGLLPGTLLQLGSWRLAGIFVPAPPPLSTWTYTLGLYLLTNTLGISLVFLAATLTRRMLPLLLSWTALWGVVFFKVEFMEGLTERYFPMATLAFWNVFFHNLALSPTLRLGLLQRLALSMLVWFLGLALAAFALAGLLGWLFDQRRTLRNLVVWGALSAAGLVVLAGGYALNAAAAAAAPPLSPLDPQIDHWQVVEQTTRVEINTRNGELNGTATLHLEPGEDLQEPRLVLRLNPGLAVTRAIAGGNEPLTWERQGDSVTFALPAPPEGALWLELAWEGELQISFLSYDLPWNWADAPDDYSYTYAPLPVRGLVLPQVGYLLRDGDWMPWPWVTTPHQAQVGRVSIALNGAQAIAPAPLSAGEVTLDAPLPEALLVYHDAAEAKAGNMKVIATPRLNALARQQVYLFAAAVQQASEMLGETPPGTLVALPYLDRIIWAGDLLLLPDGSGKYISNHLSWMQGLYSVQDRLPGAENPAGLERTTLAALLRQWMLERAPAAKLEYRSLIMGSDGWWNPVTLNAATREKWWDEQGGRWAQYPEAKDVFTWWAPRRNTSLEPVGKLSALAFWLATETSHPGLILDDLALVEKLDTPGAVIGGNETYNLASARSWPEVMYSAAGRSEVQALHEWALKVGQPRANELVLAALLQNQPLVAEELWQILATESGVALMGVQP